MKRIAPLLTLIFLSCAGMAPTPAAAEWKCWAHSQDNGQNSWGKAASEAEAKGLALGNCNGASHERCFISNCTMISGGGPSARERSNVA